MTLDWDTHVENHKRGENSQAVAKNQGQEAFLKICSNKTESMRVHGVCIQFEKIYRMKIVELL